jgi:hypothetical protein
MFPGVPKELIQNEFFPTKTVIKTPNTRGLPSEPVIIFSLLPLKVVAHGDVAASPSSLVVLEGGAFVRWETKGLCFDIWNNLLRVARGKLG